MNDQVKDEFEVTVLNNKNITIRLTKCKPFNFSIPNLNQFEKHKLGYVFKEKVRGIYCLVNDDQVIYIGMSCFDIESRLKAHIKFINYDSFLFYSMNDKFKIAVTEAFLILKYKPLLNRDLEGKFK